MHLKPISRELRRELYGRRRKGYKLIHYLFTFRNLSKPACVVVFVAIHNLSSASTAATGLGLDHERGDLAQETEVEEVAVTTRDVAPETESVQGDSEPQAMTTCPSLSVSIPSLFLSLYPSRCIVGLIERYLIFEAVTALTNLFFLDF